MAEKEKCVDVDFVAVGRGQRSWRSSFVERYITYTTLADEVFRGADLESNNITLEHVEHDGTIRICDPPERQIGTIILADYHGQKIK